MSIVKRYVVLETLKVFGGAVAITLLLLVLGGGAREGIRQGLPPRLALHTIPYLVPEFLRFTVPGCLLFAVCRVFGRMAEANEFVAIKSLGISPLALLGPVFVLAYLLGVVTFGMYDVCAQWARPGLRRLVTESLSEIAYGYLRTNGSFSRHGVSIIVKGVRGDLLLEPLLTFEPGDGKPLMTLAAQEARLQTKAEAGILRVECRNGQLEVVGKVKLSFPDWREYDLEINPPIPDRENHASPSELGCGVIPRQIRREQRLVAELEPQLIVARQASLVRAADLAAQLKERRARLFRLQAEIPRRLANGFGCVCFALLGVPVAMWRRSADTMSVFFLCFVPILVIYYPLLVTGENLSRSGVWPLFSVWLADAVLLVIGIGLLTRMMRH